MLENLAGCGCLLRSARSGRAAPNCENFLMLLSPPPTRPPEPKATILLVDDSPAMLRHLRSLLESDSYQVEIAANGEEALQRMQGGFAPAVVVLDLRVPSRDGLRTLRSLLKLCPSLKVIMFSGGEDPGQMQRAVSLGAQVYLTQPVAHLYLSAAVERCLAAKGSPPVKYATASAK